MLALWQEKNKTMTDNNDLASMRVSYKQGALDESMAPASPWTLFSSWFTEASQSPKLEANAMTLSTVDSNSRPNSRIVLLKGYNEDGFSFFTNLESRKAADIDFCPHASLLFFWPEQERQVRVKGDVIKIPDQEAREYFSTRPRESQLGAWASYQSQVIESRDVLEDKYKQIEKKYPTEVPKPPFWGGYRVRPSEFEFWQGRVGRLHDRLCYKQSLDKWDLSRLAP